MELITAENIDELLKKGGKDKALATEAQRYHCLHNSGKGYIEWWLKRAEKIESENSFNLKKKLARPTTPRIVEQIKKQYYKIFRAKGFIKNYRFKSNDQSKQDQLDEILQTVCEGVSVDEFMQQVWFNAMFEDFNGFIGVELRPEEEMLQDAVAEPYVKFYPLKDVIACDVELGSVEWIILEWDENKIRAIDTMNDSIYEKKDGKYVLVETMPNPFGMVPFMQVSKYRNNVHSEFLKNSPISNVIPNLNYYQSLSDDHVLTRKLHSNPIFYSYPVTCPTCNGSKLEKYNSNDSGVLGQEPVMMDRTCSTCTGQGVVPHWKRDTSQGITLPITENMEREGFPAAAPPAGYVQIDVESINKQIEGLEIEEKKIEKGTLGTDGILSAAPRERTATEREIDLQPLMDALSAFSANAEQVHKFIVDVVGKIVFGDDFIEAYIHYGRKYYLRSEQYVMEEFDNAKKSGAPETYLRELLEELIHVRFENNPKALIRAMILLDLEPFPARTNVDEVIKYANYCSRETIVIKANFNDFIERFENENGHIVAFGAEQEYNKKIQAIKQKLIEYAKEINPIIVDGGTSTVRP